jgi:N6-adenosine-specific RNA methylase IME4
VRHAFAVADGWGFKFSTLLTWCKTTMGGGLGGDAFGISSEFLLFCRRGRLPARERINRTWFEWPRRYDDRGKPMSGAKPLLAYDLVERVSPGPHVELFSREQKPRMGWDYWGDQSLGTAEMPAA